MSGFDHLVLTRFNTQVSYAPGNHRFEDDWLRSRLEPFEAVCLPSMRVQSATGFRWVVLVDIDSPEWFKARMESFAPLVDVVYVTGVVRTEDLAPLLRHAGLVTRPHVITTRLDSDDALSSDHLATVQAQFKGQRRTFIEFPAGYQLMGGSLYATVWRSNPFLSLIESVREDGSFDTAICRPHNQVVKAEDCISLWRSPMWLQSIHATNNESGLKVGVPRLSNAAPRNFNITLSPAPRPDRFAASAKTLKRRLIWA